MGFFVEDDALPGPAAKRVGGAKKSTYDRGQIGCDFCSLRQAWPRILTPRMPMQGSADADILILGTSPSNIDDDRGALWQGDKADKLLQKAIPPRERDRVAWQSMIRCYPNGLPFGNIQNAHACSGHLAQDIEASKIKYILGIGDLPLRYLAPGLQIHQAYGLKLPIKIGSRIVWYMPVYDPFYVYTHQGKYDDGPVAPIFNSDIKRFFAELDKWPEPQIADISPADGIIPESRDEAEALLTRMEGSLGVDIETNRLKPMINSARLLTGAFSDGRLTIAFPIDHPEKQTSWGLRLLLDTLYRRRWIAHNAGFELLWFTYMAEKLGERPAFAPFDDTMAMPRLHYERTGILDLGSVTHIELGVNIKKLTGVDARRIMEFPLAEVLPYNGLDALGSALIAPKLLPLVQGRNYQRFMDSIHATSRMELMGLTPDLAASAELRAEWEAKTIAATADHRKIYEVRQFEAARQEEFNIGSPEHVGEALAVYGKVNLPKTEGGKQYSTDDDLLRREAPDNPLVKAVLAHREGTKMCSTYIEPIEITRTLYADQLLHPSYTTLRVNTTRLSSEDPNIQNYPKRKHIELRRQVRARDGHLFYAFDFGQLEARVIAMATRDRNLCESIIKGDDIHSRWLGNCLDIYPSYLDRLATETNQKEEKKIRKYGRDIIKTDFVFAAFFGATAHSITQRTKIPLELVKELLAEFWREFIGVRRWIEGRRAYYESTGRSILLTGISRHQILWGNEPINNPIQGSAACIVVESMNELAALARDCDDMYLHPRVNIHDDLMFELPEDLEKAEPYVRGIMQTMTDIRFDWQVVPLMVEAKCGPNWAELEEFTTYTGDYVK